MQELDGLREACWRHFGRVRRKR